MGLTFTLNGARFLRVHPKIFVSGEKDDGADSIALRSMETVVLICFYLCVHAVPTP